MGRKDSAVPPKLPVCMQQPAALPRCKGRALRLLTGSSKSGSGFAFRRFSPATGSLHGNCKTAAFIIAKSLYLRQRRNLQILYTALHRFTSACRAFFMKRTKLPRHKPSFQTHAPISAHAKPSSRHSAAPRTTRVQFAAAMPGALFQTRQFPPGAGTRQFPCRP